MRYRLRTLMIVLALGPPVLAGLWAGRQWLGATGAAIGWAALGWAVIMGFFALWYWMLCKSQAMDPRTRGGEPTSYG
jgi:hypothetical protein